MRQYNNNYTIHDFVLQVPNEKKSWISERCGDNEEIGAESACKTASKVKCICYQGQGKGFRSSLFPERLAGVQRAEPSGRPPQRTKSVCERLKQVSQYPTDKKF